MAYIITSKTRKHQDRRISEKYFKKGGVEELEKDGLSKFEAFRELNRLTDSGVTVDERRDIVEDFVKREKPL